jgi:hypothetical protein
MHPTITRSPRLRRAVAAFALTAGVSFVQATPTLAAGAQCRASAARITASAPLPLAAEPLRANAGGAPCSRQSAQLLEPTAIGPVHLELATAVTDLAEGPTAGSMARATAAVVSLPGATIRVSTLQASAIARCAGGQTVLDGTSRVDDLTINDSAIAITDPEAPRTIDLGGAGSLRLNEAIEQDGTTTRRALALDTPDATIVLAEASVGGDACAAGEAGTGGQGTGAGDAGADRRAGAGTSEGICPAGASYDAKRGACVVEARSSSNATSRDVVIGSAFEGPSGGRVIELRTARARLRSRCLSGRGPAYVVVGTGGRDRITGTNGADRVLLRGGSDQVSTGRGNDCVDGGRGRDVIAGAQGSDTLVGGSGNDALDGGSANDVLIGGTGRDTISAGYGRDRVNGGAGNDAINVAVAGPAARRVSCGSGRDTARINVNERRRVRGCEVVYRLR